MHVSCTIFDQYWTSSLSWYWRASRSAIPIILSAIPIILSAKGESHYYQF